MRPSFSHMYSAWADTWHQEVAEAHIHGQTGYQFSCLQIGEPTSRTHEGRALYGTFEVLGVQWTWQGWTA